MVTPWERLRQQKRIDHAAMQENCKDGGPEFELLRELTAAGWRALERGGENRSLGYAAGVGEDQRGEQAERGDDADKEKRQNGGEIRCVAGVAVRDEQQQECKPDCKGCNQNPSAPLPGLNHCRASRLKSIAFFGILAIVCRFSRS
jgi:hypothetical protein